MAMERTGEPEFRVGLVDGYPLSREGLRAFLSGSPGLRVVGEAEDGAGATRLLADARPDLVVLGFNLAGGSDGVEVCRSLKRASDPPKVLVLTGHNFAEAMLPFFLAGADSYVHRRSERPAIVDAARRTAAGERVWTVTEEAGQATSVYAGDPGASRLTSRELEVLTLKLDRRSNAEIARRLNISAHTVKHHVSSINRKLGKTLG